MVPDRVYISLGRFGNARILESYETRIIVHIGAFDWSIGPYRAQKIRRFVGLFLFF